VKYADLWGNSKTEEYLKNCSQSNQANESQTYSCFVKPSCTGHTKATNSLISSSSIYMIIFFNKFFYLFEPFKNKIRVQNTEGDPNLSVYRVRTVPCRTVAYRTVPYRTVPYRTVPYRTVPYRTVPYRTVFRDGPFWSTAQRTVFF
jgi:hypothetical protein